jgi:hypothetical protein
MSLTKKTFPFVYISQIGVGVYIAKYLYGIFQITKNFLVSSKIIQNSETITTTKTVSAA